MEYLIAILVAAAALAVVAVPLLRRTPLPVDAMRDATVEEDIARYRAALRADTVCARCGQANPGDARYCYECGRTLPRMDAEEFDGRESA